MLTQEIRRKFLSYFQQSGHMLVPSSPVVPHDDPTLLFINAGMNQFKDVFLGKSERDYKRAVTSQKCIRVGGKHNDLENVGHTSRHLTFFEMLGNFSFGDYFKEEAIRFAWEVSTTVFGLPEEKLWASVYREDEEAFALWEKFLPQERIVRLGERDNFWAMGETGPCGPCSELLYDRGEVFGAAPTPYEDVEGERFPEFWNLVFMEFNRDEAGVMKALPRKSIDTGGGLERIVAFKIGADSVFETDIFVALIRQVERLSQKTYDPHSAHRAAPFRVIADHLRALAFAIADGVQPSNVERGYVLRKVLRRAVRYGRQLAIDRPFLAELLPTLIELMGEDYPELIEAKGRTQEILTQEEEAFLRTLRRGGNLLNAVLETAKTHEARICGDDAFKLKDTYGLPLEEILLIAKDSECTVDLERYQQLEQEAKERSRKKHKVTQQIGEEGAFLEHVEHKGASRFLGYVQTGAKGAITGLFVNGKPVDAIRAGEEALVVLDQTPFYAEKGGQVGDSGELVGSGVHFHVTDTQEPYTGVIAHSGKLEQGELKVGLEVEARVNKQRRRHIQHNHTATHLLHWALQEVLGSSARQAGSVVDPDRLRFDFHYHKALTPDEIHMIEDLVNRKIQDNDPVQTYELDYKEASERSDIQQFFGDKYGNVVRVVDVGYSKELCGGTHTALTGHLGYFRITKEGSIAAGVRRIEAVTGAAAIDFARASDRLLDEIASLLGTTPAKLLDRTSKLVEEHTHYAREMKQAKKREVARLGHELASQAEPLNEYSLVVAEADVEAGDLRDLAEAILDTIKGVVVLGCARGERCALLATASKEMVDQGFHAGKLIKQLAPIVGGGGGGKADLAQAGGKEPSKLSEALTQARTTIVAS